jgi:hypothetical protein
MNPKCQTRPWFDTFSAKSADLTGLKMRRITRAFHSITSSASCWSCRGTSGPSPGAFFVSLCISPAVELGCAPPGVGHHARGARHSVFSRGRGPLGGREHLHPNAGTCLGFRLMRARFGGPYPIFASRLQSSARTPTHGEQILHRPPFAKSNPATQRKSPGGRVCGCGRGRRLGFVMKQIRGSASHSRSAIGRFLKVCPCDIFAAY